ncbi:MAG: carotenoid biosynthesis protein [Chloroflexi bacterium]|nr:carotenoid biosynthesis protein [Chloroflexota bacterium]
MRRVAIIAFTLYALAITYTVLNAILRTSTPHWLLTGTTLLFFVFAVIHANDRFGLRSMLVFLALSFGVSFIFETVGVLTGLVYGQYYYTDRLGPKLGVVPFLIPLAWFMMMYASNTVVEIVAGETARSRSSSSTALIAFLGAMAMTAWDLGMDPQMVARSHWVWVQGGAYFGIPVQNFIGWLATTFTVFFLFRLYESRQPARPWQFDNRYAWLPVAAYAVQGLATIIVGITAEQSAPALVTFFGMGAFLFSAITQITGHRSQVASLNDDAT